MINVLLANLAAALVELQGLQRKINGLIEDVRTGVRTQGAFVHEIRSIVGTVPHDRKIHLPAELSRELADALAAQAGGRLSAEWRSCRELDEHHKDGRSILVRTRVRRDDGSVTPLKYTVFSWGWSATRLAWVTEALDWADFDSPHYALADFIELPPE